MDQIHGISFFVYLPHRRCQNVEPKIYTKYFIVIGVDLGKTNDVDNDIFRTQRC